MRTCQYYNGEPCINLAEGNTDYCGTHNRLIRKQKSDEQKAAEKAEKTLKKAKLKQQIPKAKPKQISDKRKELNNEYFKLVDQFKRDNPRCAARLAGCTGATDDPHHKRGRGAYLLDVTTWLPVCRNCHIWITDNSKEAMEKGLSESRLAINQTKPTI